MVRCCIQAQLWLMWTVPPILQVADMYKNQAIHNTKGGGNKADDEDY